MSDTGAEAVRRAFASAEEFDEPGSAPPPEGEEIAPPDILTACAALPLNDFGNGQRLVAHFGSDLIFVPRLGWFRWNGKVWRPDEDELQVRELAHQISDRILAEIWHLAVTDRERDLLDEARQTREELQRLEKMQSKERSDDQSGRYARLRALHDGAAEVRKAISARRKSHRAHARAAGNSRQISNMLLEAQVRRKVEIDQLNIDPLMLNTLSGVLRFTVTKRDAGDAELRYEYEAAVSLLPHDRDQRISKLCPVDYDPTAKAPLFDKFLERIHPSEAMRKFVQRWFGYCLTGLTVEQKMAFFHGGGRNGKSTLVDVVARILADYSTTLPIESLTGMEQRKGSDATPDLIKLPGARFVRASEPEQGQKLKEALIKALTGGEPINIRRMAKEFFEITPIAKFTISGNHKPEIRGDDEGIWRRVLLVPFGEHIPKEEVDKDLPAKLWEQRSGILNWLVQGCLDYLEHGLAEPAEVLEATESYRQDSDPVRVFLTEECEITEDPADFELARDLGDAFNAWLLANNIGAWGKRTVANAFKAKADTWKDDQGRTFSPMKRSDTGYCRIRLRTEARDRIAKFGEDLRAAAARKG